MDLDIEIWHKPKITDYSIVVMIWNMKEVKKFYVGFIKGWMLINLKD